MVGPVTSAIYPNNCFNKKTYENLTLRAIVSSGLGDDDYQDKIFTSRITLPKSNKSIFEAIAFSFITREDEIQEKPMHNAQCLSLFTFIYPRDLRSFVERIELNLEHYLKNWELLPSKLSQIKNGFYLNYLISALKDIILTMEENAMRTVDMSDMSSSSHSNSTNFRLQNFQLP